jgi:hypothetical protein
VQTTQVGLRHHYLSSLEVTMTQTEVTLDVIPVQFCRILAEVIRRILTDRERQAVRQPPAGQPCVSQD